LEWSLAELYESFESDKWKADLQSFKDALEAASRFAKENFGNFDDPIKKAEEFLHLYVRAITLEQTLGSFAHLTLAVDVLNETAAKASDVIEELATGLTEPVAAFERFIADLPDFDALISGSEVLRAHAFVLGEIREQSKYLLSPAEESAIAKMAATGSSAWEKLRDQLTATLPVELEENGEKKTVPLSVARNLAHSPSAETRKNAYTDELSAYEKIDKSVSFCLNSIKGEVLSVCKLRGYASPLEMTLLHARMDRPTLDALLGSMERFLPVFRKFLRHKARLLGYDGGLKFYDLFAPISENNQKYSFEEASKYVLEVFGNFSADLRDFANTAFTRRWIDVYPRDGKTGGAFCSSIHPIKESRFMLNFGGNWNDVTTLAHELGHGYHSHCLREQLLLNSSYSMPIAETASTFCETLVLRDALGKAADSARAAILNFDITDTTQIIVDIYSRYLFETEIFRSRAEGSLSVGELKDAMLSAQKTAYGDGLDHEYLHSYMWVNKSHYYYASHNFYNFPYAYGLLFAKGLYAKYLREGAAFAEEYAKILESTGTRDLADVAAMAGIDVRSVDFWDSSLKIVETEVDEFLEI
jgi:pepF/M3 family oligoendopeptidase